MQTGSFKAEATHAGRPTPCKRRDIRAAPERTCIVTRQSLPTPALLRFVADPDGQVIVDLAHRLPGRGMWVSCSRAIVEKAVKNKAFARSLRRKVVAPDDLADRVEELMIRRTLSALSMANKAGLGRAGSEKVKSALAAGDVRILLHATDGSADGCKKLDQQGLAVSKYLGFDLKILSFLTSEQLGLAFGRPSVVHAALNTGGTADRFLAEAEQLARYRGSHSETADVRRDSERDSGQSP